VRRYLAILALVGVSGWASSSQTCWRRRRTVATFWTLHDTAGATYNVPRARPRSPTAVRGSLFKGPQTQLGFVPEQQTDFIFTVVGEELGFAGAATLLVLFAIVMWRTWRAAQLARDLLGTLICVGVLAMFGFQVFESVGMTMGIMPVTGIPLPFMSYGGSSTIACFVAIGLVLNVHMHRFR
jgi:rod shape determining protein RodA